jgi:hypothetical protein
MAKEVKKNETTESTDLTVLGGIEGIGTGFEGTNSGTFKTPFLKVLQAMSPELKKNDPKYITGAEQGQLCNTATNEAVDNMEIVVLKIEHVLVVWVPERGGLVGRFPKSKEDELVTKRDGAKKWTAEGNEVVDTIELYCLDIANPEVPFIFPLSTTSLKYGKSFATRMRALRVDGKQVPVSWAGVWKISTMEESNDKGSWYTLGNTPDFQRLITVQERDEYVVPAIEMLKTAAVDYSQVDASVHTEDSPEY